jgi:hypothetical protein
MGGDFTKRTVWLVCLMLVLSTTFALGQGIVTGSIAGTVVDPQKAVVPGAKVAAKNVATNVEYKTTTNDQGYFSIRSIPTGTYAVSVQAPNFKRLDVANVVVNTGVTTDMGALALALGATAETITVEAAAPLIETTSAQGSATFTGATAQNLPLNGGFDQLALYTPGIVTSGQLGGLFPNSNGASFSSNGQRDRSNTFQIDGQFNNDTGVTGPAIFFANQDALQEVQVVTNNFGVEYGRTSGSTVNYVTKSGTNNFHGSAFEYYTGNFADSMTHLEGVQNGGPGTTARYTENRWGGTLGGPIVPNKIFFFTSYLQDTAKAASPPSVTSGTMLPTPTGMTQLATCYPSGLGSSAVGVLSAIGPYSIKQGNPQPFGTPVTLNLGGGATGLAPCAVEFAGITRSVPAPANSYDVTGRADFVLSPKDQFFARYLFTQDFIGNNGAGQFGDVAEGGAVTFLGRNQQIALDWTRNVTNHLVNQVRFSYVREASSFPAGSYPTCLPSALGTGCPTFFNFSNGIEPFGLGVNIPQSGLTNNSQWQDNASWQHGRHLVKFGGEYDRQRAPNIFMPNIDGRYTFTDSAFAAGCAPDDAICPAVNTFNAFLAQAPTQQVIVASAPSTTLPFKEQDADMYLGDDWRIKENLTINLGVRWEFTQQAFNLLAQQTIQRELNPATALFASVDPTTGLPIPLSQRTVPVVPNHYDHFAPSVGFAWTPHMFESLLGHDKTVIRGGFRLAYNPAFYNMYLNAGTAAPAINLASFACPAPCGYGATGADVHAVLAPFILGKVNPGIRTQTRVSNNFTNPYAEEWTLGIQREISGKVAAEVRYVGSHTVHEFQTVNGNPQLCLSNTVAGGCVGGLFGDFPAQVPAGVTPCATPGAPGFSLGFANCNLTLDRLRDNGGVASYHSLQSQLKFQSWHGLTAVAAYTYSKAIDNASEIFSAYGPSAIAGPQDPFCVSACEKGLSAIDYPHNLTLFWQYDFPFGRGQTNALGRVLGGWSLGGTYRYTSGQVWTPFEPANRDHACNDSFNNNFFSASSCRPFMGNPGAPVTAVGECTNPLAADCGLADLATGAPTTLAAVHWILNNDNAAQFFHTPFGNVGRNPPGVRGDTVNTVNLNLIKNTRISERVNVKLEANVYNLFNREFLGTPCADIIRCGPGFGNGLFNDSGGINAFTGAGVANAVGTGLAQRRMVLGAHIIF